MLRITAEETATEQRWTLEGRFVLESFRREGAVNVLKITIDETPTEKRWILQGRLVGLWVGELRRAWKKTPRPETNRPCVVDLNDVTSIDEKGVRLLRAMSKQGAQFVSSGIYIKHVLQQRCER
jgi:hypothetical protein